MNEDIFHLGIKALIINDKHQILLLKVNKEKLIVTKGWNGQVYWDIPGGRVKKNAVPEETLKSEIHEELGVTNVKNIQPLAIVLSNIRIPLDSQNHVGLILSVYTCDIPKNAKITLSEEHTEYGWFTPKKAAKMLEFKYPKQLTDVVSQLK